MATPAFRNSSLPLADRVTDLVGRMTLDEKISLMTNASPAVERLGVDYFAWYGECLHGLVLTGEATVFPVAIALAATFDTDLIRRVADAIASEARGKYNDPAWRRPGRGRIGLTFWTPVINILRDPRWGRAQETYGEDPYLTSAIGVAFVEGLQGNDPKLLKAAACAKHMAVHNGPERLRIGFDAVVSPKDLNETYLPAFQALVDANVQLVMATYNAVNGEPCGTSKTLLRDILREQLGYDGCISSDGGSLSAPHNVYKVAADAVETAAMCIKAGLDIELGNCAFPQLAEAIKRGLIDESEIDVALGRILAVRFRLGEFDDPAEVPWSTISSDVIRCDEHLALTRESAAKSVILLKNNGILPLPADTDTVLVAGPNAGDVQVLLGAFYRGISPNMQTIVEGIVAEAPKGTVVTHMQGCFLHKPNDYPSKWVFGLADWADAVVAVVGLSPLLEGEGGECIGTTDGGDREAIELPPNQIEFLRDMKARGKPLIVVVTGGAPVAMPEVHEMADALLFAWYPGEQGGGAVGSILFGHESPSGRLPATFPMSTDLLPDYTDYRLTNRTYRYMTDEPLYPFGYGLSYTTFEYGAVQLSADQIASGDTVQADVTVTNTGACEAEEVVQLYITDDEASVVVPRSSLRDFQRIRLAPGASGQVRFEVTPVMLALVNDEGKHVLEPGSFTLTIGGSSPSTRNAPLGAAELVTAKLVVT